MKKYGRTYHLPNSPGATNDDKVMTSLGGLTVGELVITEKMDGENTTIHRGGTHARSPDSRTHSSRDWLKGFSAAISVNLADEERIIGENLFARHSISYDHLPSFFLGFALIVEDVVQSWDTTLRRFETLGITPVPQLFRGPYSESLFDEIAGSLDSAKQEGFVVRSTTAFPEAEMRSFMGKWVRPGHVQSDKHWLHDEIVPNRMA